MVKILRSIVTWLEKRFPEKVIVTLENYNDILKRVEALEKTYPPKRIQEIETELNKINVELGLGGLMQNSLRAPFQR